MSKVRVTGVNKTKFRKALVGITCGCAIQHNGWPCGTCFFSAIDDEAGDDWRAVLAYRGDYDDEINGDHITMAVDWDAVRKQHVTRDIPLTEVRERIQKLAENLGVKHG